MKKITTCALIALLALGSCKKKIINPINNETTFDITSEELIYVKDALSQVPFSLPGPGPFPPGIFYDIPFPPKSYYTDYNKYLSEYNTSVDKIKKTEVIETSIKVVSPATEKLDYFDNAHIYVASKEKPDFVLSAFKDPIPNGLDSVNLDRTSLDYKPYFVTDSTFMKLTVRLSGVPDSTTIYKIKTVMRLTLSGN